MKADYVEIAQGLHGTDVVLRVKSPETTVTITLSEPEARSLNERLGALLFNRALAPERKKEQ